ncbi:hypothetical protein ACW2Q0_29785 [Nocardia sp. R16R-3T]
MSTRKPVQWGVKVGRSVRHLPNISNITQALLIADKIACGGQSAKHLVVYRHSDSEMWRSWIGDREQPTQLTLDLSGQEAAS